MCVLLLFSQDPTDIVSTQCAEYQFFILFCISKSKNVVLSD